jgi:hypothetical protein
MIVSTAALAGVVGGWVLATAPVFDPPAGAATQQTALPADADPAAIERAALGAFNAFARLRSAGDLAYLAYYHQDAAIHVRVLYSEGRTEEFKFRRGNWAGLQKDTPPKARANGATYSQIHTHMADNLVIVEAKRSVEIEDHTGPYKVAMVQTSGGEWRVIEEWIESKRYSDD